MSRSVRAGAAALAVTLVGGVGCSKDDTANPTSTTKAPATSALTSQSFTISNLLTRDAQYTTVKRLLDKAGLTASLDGTDDFTLFAPDEEAFKQVSTLAATEADPKGKLADLLRRLIVAGTHDKGDLVSSPNVTLNTLAGTKISVALASGHLVVGGATVKKENIRAKNGVIHVIDRVL